jgi:hypothetical protein
LAWVLLLQKVGRKPTQYGGMLSWDSRACAGQEKWHHVSLSPAKLDISKTSTTDDTFNYRSLKVHYFEVSVLKLLDYLMSCPCEVYLSDFIQRETAQIGCFNGWTSTFPQTGLDALMRQGIQ